MSAESNYPLRYPLGLPAGSVRSILSIMIAGLFCALLLTSTVDRPVVVPPYVIGLLLLILISFLNAQGRSMNKRRTGEASPLGLPPWSVRILMLGGVIATIAYKITQDEAAFIKQIEATLDAYKSDPLQPIYLLGYMLGGYLLGHFSQMIFGLDNQSRIYQDFVAWVSILAMIGMTIVLIVTLVINPAMREEPPVENMDVFEGILAGITAFYFSARS